MKRFDYLSSYTADSELGGNCWNDQPGKEDNMLKFITHLVSETPVSIGHHFGVEWVGQQRC